LFNEGAVGPNGREFVFVALLVDVVCLGGRDRLATFLLRSCCGKLQAGDLKVRSL